MSAAMDRYRMGSLYSHLDSVPTTVQELIDGELPYILGTRYKDASAMLYDADVFPDLVILDCVAYGTKTDNVMKTFTVSVTNSHPAWDDISAYLNNIKERDWTHA